MQILTRRGYRDSALCKRFNRVLAFDFVTGKRTYNRIKKVEFVPCEDEDWVLINGKFRLHRHQSLWANGNVTHAGFLKFGDVIYVDKDHSETVVDLEFKAGGPKQWTKLEVTGDHSFIADGITLHNASRFWVLGTGTWDAADTTHWSATSNGSGGASVPGGSDAVTLDGSSGGGTVTASVDQTIASLTFGTFTGTLIVSSRIINAAFVSGTGTATRTFTASSTTFNLSGASQNAWDFTTITGLTRTLTSSVINLTGASATFQGGAITTYATVTQTGGGAMVMAGANTIASWTVTGTAVLTDSIQLNASITATLLNLSGNSQVNRLFVKSNSNSAARSITTAAASATLANIDLFRITAVSGAAWTGTSLGNAQGCTNITFTAPATQTWQSNGGNFSDVAHWVSGVMPLPQDTANFDATSITLAAQTITMDTLRLPALNFTGILNAPTVAWPGSRSMYGSVTLAASVLMTYNNIDVDSLNWLHLSGTCILTTNTCDQIANMNMGAASSTTITAVLQLGDNLHLKRQLTHTLGEFDANDFDIYTDQFRSNGTSVRTVRMGNGTWHMSDANGSIWTIVATGMTMIPEGSTILFGSINDHTTPTQTRKFTGAGLTYNNFTWDEQVSTFGLDIVEGGDIFATFAATNTATQRDIKFLVSTTTTATQFALSGAPGALLGLISSSAGTQATLSQASGTVSGSYLSIRDINATGGAQFNAGKGSRKVSNVTGWKFSGGGILKVHGRYLPL